MLARLVRGCVRDKISTSVLLLLGLPAIVGWASAEVQEMSVPVNLQLRLLSRVLQFDRRFPENLGEEVVLGVLYQSRFRASLDAMSAARSALEEKANRFVGEVPLRVVALDMDEGLSLADALADRGIDVLYVAPLRSVEIRALSRISREGGVLTFTGVPEYLRMGLAVSVGSRRGRPEILINADAAAAEGVLFSSELLKIATLVEGSSGESDAPADPTVP